MRKSAVAAALLVALFVMITAPGLAWARHGLYDHGLRRHPARVHGVHPYRHRPRVRVFVGIGPVIPYRYWYYPPPYYAYAPPRVIVQEPPPVYIQQSPPVYVQPPPAPAPPAPPEPAYWYYCPSAGAYYPTAPTCPEPWVRVPPRSE
jgi:hypothetical protein